MTLLTAGILIIGDEILSGRTQDTNGNFIAKTVNTLTVLINPNLIIDEKKLLINLQLIFPDKDFSNIKKRIKKKKIFSNSKRT